MKKTRRVRNGGRYLAYATLAAIGIGVAIITGQIVFPGVFGLISLIAWVVRGLIRVPVLTSQTTDTEFLHVGSRAYRATQVLGSVCAATAGLAFGSSIVVTINTLI